jgi:hypothetical protein
LCTQSWGGMLNWSNRRKTKKRKRKVVD